PPAHSTLFTYTTLFRSLGPFHDVVLGPGANRGQTDIGGIRRRQKDRRGGWLGSSLALEQAHAGRVGEDVVDQQQVEATGMSLLEDRKSTRLNSSHQIIS